MLNSAQSLFGGNMFKKLAGIFGAASLVALAVGGNVAAANAAGAAASLPIAMSSAAQCRDGNDRRVTIINETGITIMAFFASPPDASGWEEDILGSDVISGYGSQSINFDDGRCRCVYDFKAVFADGDELVREQVNVCEISTFRYN